jgi:hypothetical protein
MIFFLASRIQESWTAMKLVMIGFDALAIAATLALLRRDALPRERILIYAWHPLPVWEFAGSGHVDAAAIALLCLALLAALHRRPATAGGILAAATLIKPFAVVVAPALWRKWDWRLPAAFVLTAASCYVPYLTAGQQALGFLGGYGDEEGYWDGKGFFVVDLLRHIGVAFPPGAAAFALASVLAGLGVFVALRPNRDAGDSRSSLLLGTAFLVIASPHFAWYFAWVLPFLCRQLYLPLLFLTLGCFILYLPEIKDWADYFKAGLWLYGAFAILAFGDWAMRHT